MSVGICSDDVTYIMFCAKPKVFRHTGLFSLFVPEILSTCVPLSVIANGTIWYRTGDSLRQRSATPFMDLETRGLVVPRTASWLVDFL